MHSIIGDVARHGGESAQWIDRVEVAEQEDGLQLFAAGKIDLHAVGVVFGVVHASVSTDGFETSREECAHAVGSGLVVAGGFDFDELANGLDDLFLARFEVAQALGPDGIGVECFRSTWLGACSFLARHDALVSGPCRGRTCGPSRTV